MKNFGMKSQQLLLVFITIIFCRISKAKIQLENLSTLYLPYSYTPPTFHFGRDVAEQGAYDANKKLVYIVGNDLLHVIDVSTPEEPKVIFHTTLKDGTLTDIDTCGDYVAVSYDNEVDPLDGQVIIYRGYNLEKKKMEKLHEITVGSLPDMLIFTSDCRKIVVAIEGVLRKINNEIVDPEGEVAIIRFLSDDLSSQPLLSIINFTKFNKVADKYVARGVRWVFRGEGTSMTTTFSQDLEPEYVTINEDETKAFVVLQENNAIAVIDIMNDNVIEIYPLGAKSWKKLVLDTSDKDEGINLRSWALRGLYQPDALQHVIINGHGYIITANEGEEKEYEEKDFGFDFIDSRPGQYFVNNDLLHRCVPKCTRKALANDTQLGRLILSTIDGKHPKKEKFKTLYAYGGRSFSIWNERDISLVYDSGDEFEKRIAQFFPKVFNSGGRDGPEINVDGRSRKKGPEPESLGIGEVNGKTVIFVGIERPGIILIYSFPNNDVTSPEFESAHYAGGNGDTWEKLYELRKTSDVDPENIIFVPDSKSPNGKPMLIVSGAVSGTVSLYKVVDMI